MAASTIFPIFLRAEYNDSTGLQRFQSDAARAAQAAKREFQGVGAALDNALARPRNNVGSLDLGLDELRQAAIVQQQVAAAAREVAEATNRARASTTGYDAALSKSTQAAFKLAAAEDAKGKEMLQQIQILEQIQAELDKTASATDQLIQSQRRGTTARGSVINSVRAERTAFIQLGQQMQDVTVQAQMGTDGFLIFSQQVPQAAFALSGLADSSNETLASVGEFAGFLSGPWGAALFAATAVLGPYVFALFETEEAAEAAATSVKDLVDAKRQSAAEAVNAAQAEDIFARSLAGVTDAVRNNEEALKRLTSAKRTDAEETLNNSRIQLANALALQFNTQQRLFNAKAILDAQVARATGPSQQADLAALGLTGKQENLEAALADFAKNSGNIANLLRQIEGFETTVSVERGVAGEEGAINRRYEAELEGLKKTAAARGLSRKAIEEEAAAIRARKDAALEALKPDRKTRPDRSAEREREKLDNLAEKAAEQVQRVNERFDEQPRLIDQAAQASRQLNAIVADINEELATSKNLTAAQRKEFEGIKAAAADAQATIQDALVRQFEDLRRESAERLQIEELLAAGKFDEAAALQEVLRLEQILGREVDLRARLQKLIAAGNEEEARKLAAFVEAYGEMKDGVRDLVIGEERRTRELRVQAELLELQADVVRTVRDDLVSLLSGRKADFFGNFKQAIDDLRGARLFEDLFGPAFRDLEEELRGNTPQGRANARYTAEVEKTATITETLSDALIYLTDAVRGAGNRLSGAGIAANDNGGGVQILPDGSMVVTGGKADKIELATRSTKDIAERIAKATVDGFLGPLEDLLGPQFAAQLSTVLSGALAGFVRGGEAGAVLGGAKGLVDLLGGEGGKLSAGLGKALDGAETGTQIDGIIKALGIRGSKTGAQIGGAIGSAIPIPGAAQAGAAIGSIIGGLIKGTPRGSATIGGVGGSLGITGVVGNRGALKETATGLAGSVLDIIDDLARQLGATVNAGAGRVSIGQRKDNLRVDTSGRGATKIGNGAIDFGDDAEAAVAFAVQDLIKDGVITGLRAAENRLLQAGKDINAAIQDVLTFRSVFDRLKEIKDPLGFAVDQLNKEFTGLIDLFTRAGASAEEFAQLEELYGLERAKAIEDATERTSDALKSLLADLKIGDNGLSLRARRGNALTEFNTLAARVQAGDTSAFDDFADISQQLLDIERQLFGSTQSYFDRLAQITSLTETAIAGESNVTGIGADLPSPFDDRASVVRSIDAGVAEQVSWLRAINDNLIIAINSNAGGFGAVSNFRGSILPNQIANY